MQEETLEWFNSVLNGQPPSATSADTLARAYKALARAFFEKLRWELSDEMADELADNAVDVVYEWVMAQRGDLATLPLEEVAQRAGREVLRYLNDKKDEVRMTPVGPKVPTEEPPVDPEHAWFRHRQPVPLTSLEKATRRTRAEQELEAVLQKAGNPIASWTRQNQNRALRVFYQVVELAVREAWTAERLLGAIFFILEGQTLKVPSWRDQREAFFLDLLGLAETPGEVNYSKADLSRWTGLTEDRGQALSKKPRAEYDDDLKLELSAASKAGRSMEFVEQVRLAAQAHIFERLNPEEAREDRERRKSLWKSKFEKK